MLEWRVLAAVTELTASWSKLEDRTSARQIGALVYDVPAVDLTGYQRDRVGAALRRLRDSEIVTYRASRAGRGAGIIVGLPPSENTARPRCDSPEHSAPAMETQRARAGEHSARPGNTEKTEDLSDRACANPECEHGWIYPGGSAPAVLCAECAPPAKRRARRGAA